MVYMSINFALCFDKVYFAINSIMNFSYVEMTLLI